ncbi:MAG: DUF2007 domain-containing protein [Prevotella sp.]|nr:DUF2007 domain-containing protein [Prevotella sp.]
MLVKVTSCKSAFEGEMVKGLLADSGIECYLQKEEKSGIYGSAENVVVNVLVQESDVAQAKKLLEERPEPVSVTPVLTPSPRKTMRQLLLNGLGMTAFVIGINVLIGWMTGRLDSAAEYLLYALVFFVVYFSFSLWWNRKNVQ